DLAGIVAAQTETAKRLVRQRLDQFQQAGAAGEETRADKSARPGGQLLGFAVDKFAHLLYEQTFGVALENGIPFRAPQDFDDVPTSAAERGLEFMTDLSIASNR